MKNAGRNELETSQRPRLAWRICPPVDEQNGVAPAIRRIERCEVSERGRQNAGYRTEATQNVLLHAGCALRLRHIGERDCDSRHLDLFGPNEARVDVTQRLERAEHQAGGYEKDKCSRDLNGDQYRAGAMAFTAVAHCSSASPKRECDP